MTTLQPYQQRVVAECDELAERLERLLAFIASPAFDCVPTYEQLLLKRQRDIMSDLLTVLRERIEAFTGNPEPEPDFLAGVKACDLSGEGTCEACQ